MNIKTFYSYCGIKKALTTRIKHIQFLIKFFPTYPLVCKNISYKAKKQMQRQVPITGVYNSKCKQAITEKDIYGEIYFNF